MSKQKILLVDDDATFRAAIVDELRPAGFEVLEAEGGSQGLQLATTTSPDLILCDMRMPDLDGLQFLAEIKERNIPTRVVIVTGAFTDLRHTVQFIKEGACDVIHKTHDGRGSLMEIENAVRRVLALEMTLNTCVVDHSPLLKVLLSRITRLEDENRNLIHRLEGCVRRQHRKDTLTRVVYLILAVQITFLFHYLGIPSNSMIIWPLVILYIVLNLPFARIRRIVALGRGEAVFGDDDGDR
jgi:DNA-binding response OmpR family regulator